MTQFWIATCIFIALGVAPFVIASALNLRDQHSAGPADRSEAPQ